MGCGLVGVAIGTGLIYEEFKYGLIQSTASRSPSGLNLRRIQVWDGAISSVGSVGKVFTQFLIISVEQEWQTVEATRVGPCNLFNERKNFSGFLFAFKRET